MQYFSKQLGVDGKCIRPTLIFQGIIFSEMDIKLWMFSAGEISQNEGKKSVF